MCEKERKRERDISGVIKKTIKRVEKIRSHKERKRRKGRNNLNDSKCRNILKENEDKMMSYLSLFSCL